MTDALATSILVAVPLTLTQVASIIVSIRNGSKTDAAIVKVETTGTKVQEVHTLFNSRMDELLKLTKAASYREGEKAAEDKQALVASAILAGEKAAKDKAEGIK